ncbi:MAG: hypothetical protein J6R47_05760 [Acholeplasmatales bacterium]|nr:hypothetical protein [Acholeplasmatales bacterium]
MKQSKCWAADFETTTDVNDCRVWAWSACNVEDFNNFKYGNSIDSFMEFCAASKENYTCYFHNLRFDGEFILSYLFTHNYSFIPDKKEKQDYTFTTLIADTGEFYKIEVYFKVKGHHVNKVTFLDSMKIFPNMSVDTVAKSFGMPISKLKIDYHEYRAPGHIITEEELAYIRNDVEIVARALKEMFDLNLTKMTLASDALAYYKLTLPDFKQIFPQLPNELDAQVRAAYRGGFTYVSDKYKECERGAGVTLDVNSLYPSVLKLEKLPYGYPVEFEGKYEYDPVHPLYVQCFTCKFRVKPDKIPTIQIKNSMSFIQNEYLKDSKDELITLTLTNPDFELFLDHYNVEDMVYHGGWKFKAHRGYFDKYVDYWTEQKIKAGKEGNKGKRQIAKLMLNSLYGKFGLSAKCAKKTPFYREDGSIGYITEEEEERKTIYIPVAAWVTAYGRNKTIRTSQKIREYTEKKYGVDGYIYSDTDSIKANLNDGDLQELAEQGILDIDDYKLGYWACEEYFDRIFCIRQKCYVTEHEGKVDVTVAGLPKYLTPIINFDNFKRGFTTAGLSQEEMVEMARNNDATEEQIEMIHHKTSYTHCNGGVVLTDTDFTIK